MRHFVVVGILVIAVTVLTYMGLDSAGLMPVPASAQAVPIDWLWDLQVKIIAFLFALIVVPMIYSLLFFRRRKGDTTDAVHIEGNTNLEIAWTVVPLIIVLGLAYIGAENLAETRRADPNAMEVRVTGFQWGWRFEYPEYGITTNELYLPVNRQVVLKMTSTDVLHSFWVPEFRVKQDLVPGRVTELRITPTMVGDTYKVRCAEMCGTSHAYMESPVIVVEMTDFDAWVAEQQEIAAEAAQTPEGRGQALITANGCTGLSFPERRGRARSHLVPAGGFRGAVERRHDRHCGRRLPGRVDPSASGNDRGWLRKSADAHIQLHGRAGGGHHCVHQDAKIIGGGKELGKYFYEDCCSCWLDGLGNALAYLLTVRSAAAMFGFLFPFS
jgi:cytochrome c oxidase subunit II